MDFEFAAQKLARDQAKMRGRNRGDVTISVQAKREAELRKKQQRQVAADKLRKKRIAEYQEKYFRECERQLGVKSLSSSSSSSTTITKSALRLKATSIYGQGDKLALPPSVLEFLTESGNDALTNGPWTFRIAIPNPDYSFPASPLIQCMVPPNSSALDSANQQENDESDSSDEEGEHSKEAYLDELNHRYLAYTHGTVVEFTQDEGHVGLPEPISNALLDSLKQKMREMSIKIPVKRTVDPAGNTDNDMEVDVSDQTPGHLAWGAFDVPDVDIEIELVKLPKGKACTLAPTPEAIRNGFYNLKDIKLVLEQSLIRTRATLSVNDLVHTWHRGVKYDLYVKSALPSTYGAVVCVNTDIEVDFTSESDSTTSYSDVQSAQALDNTLRSSGPVSKGYVLSSGTAHPLSGRNDTEKETRQKVISNPTELRPEPPESQSEGVCLVQIRGDGSQGRRRFDVRQATVEDLFLFAASVQNATPDTFRLVTRFPRRVFSMEEETYRSTLHAAGIVPGQELFIVEKY